MPDAPRAIDYRTPDAAPAGPPPGNAVRVAAVIACAPPVGWALLRPVIVTHLDPTLRLAGLVLLGLPALLLCGVLWLVGGAMLLSAVRRATRRDVVLVAQPVALGVLTVGWLSFAPGPFRARGFEATAARAYEADPAAWDAAAAEVRASFAPDDGGTWDKAVAGLTVDEVGHDANGGVWLRTATRPDMIDQWSYGLYHQPPGGSLTTRPWGPPAFDSPFGDKGLRVTPLGGGGWHSFRANND